MGCGPSRASSFNNLDDSRHVMQNRDLKLLHKQGQKETAPPPTFKPRAENTVLKPEAISTKNIDTDIDTNPAVAAPSSFVLFLI
jgi:hypothetical protein